MRFEHATEGQRRQRTFFAWLPVQAENETRWLERVTIEEIYCDFHGWEANRFIDLEATP